MDNIWLVVGTGFMFGLPLIAICRNSELPIVFCAILVALLTFCVFLSSIFIFWGTTGLKYICDADTLIEMWSRYMDAIGCIKGWEHFPPQ